MIELYRTAFTDKFLPISAIIAEDFKNNNVDLDNIMVTHSFADKQAEFIIPRLVDLGIARENIVETKAGCVISTHCGEGTIGILYIVNN